MNRSALPRCLKLPDTAVTAAAIRLPLGNELQKWLSLMGNLAQSGIDLWGHEPGQRMAAEAFLADLDVKPSGRGTRLTPEFLEAVAIVYRAALAAGSRRPALAVKEWASSQGNDIQASTAHGWIRKAAQMGLLSKGQPGKVRTEEEA